MALNSIPLSNQTLAVTQPLIKNNFDTIDTIFAKDHATFNTINAGFHNKLTMPQQNPAPTGVAGMGLIYYFTDNQFYINNNNTTSIPFTKSINLTAGYTWLPSGILLQWKVTGAAIGANNNILFPITFPNSCLSVVLSGTNPTTGNVNQPIWFLLNFNAENYSFWMTSAPVGTSIYAFAIGY